VNDQFGHTVGDAVLVAVANRFARELPPNALLARLGGDEFAVVMEGDASLAKALADRLTRSLVEPITASGQMIVAGVSVGIATTAESGDFGVLLQRADDAMYAAKRDGRGVAAWQRTAHESSTVDRVANDLLPALNTGEMTLHFQPIVGIATRDVAGHEALLRWHHPQLGQLPPADFVKIAESRRLMVPVGRWVIEQAVATCGVWRKAGHASASVNVNISPTQLFDPSLLDILVRAIGRHGLEPQDVVLELTETAVMNDVHDSATVLRNLREAGLRIAIDDFGIGYSSLSYLADLPVDIVKLDARFTRRLCSSDRDRRLARGIISMVHAIGMIVVAEAVETEQEHDILAEFGCDLGQGYLYGRPAPTINEAPARSLRR
jgi:predicted signal transduction protein with EAL and GGDEF domain